MQLLTPAGIAFSNGASSRTMKADLPPSSRQTFLMPSPATAPTRRPAASDPVKLTMSTSGWADDRFADERALAEHDVQHAGRQPDLVRGLGEQRRAQGASSAGFSTTVQPAASAGAILQTTWCSG